MRRKAKFIWTPERKIDHGAYFGMIGSAALRREGDTNQWVCFRRRLQLDTECRDAELRITCDGRYRLHVNGHLAGRGPARSNADNLRIDKIDIGEWLHAGENVLTVLVHSPGIDLAWYETAKGNWQPVFGDGGLYVECHVRQSDGTQLLLCSDDTWRVHVANAWRVDVPRSGWGQDFIEDFDANMLSDDWLNVGFDDSGWPLVQVLESRGSDADCATGRGRLEPFPTLVPRSIPMLREETVWPLELVWQAGVQPRPDLDVDQRLYQEALQAPHDGQFEHLDELLEAGNANALVTSFDDMDASFMLAFSPYVTGCPFVELDAKGGEIIEIAASEAIPGEYSTSGIEISGLKRPDHLSPAHIFRYHARPGIQRFEKFEWTAVRALQVTVRNAPSGIRIRRIGVRTQNYPVTNAGSFHCSDELLNQLWKVGRHTALMCMHDAYEDCPGREKRQWVGDGVIHMDIAAAAFGPSAAPLAAQFLCHAMESQRPDGLVQMFGPGDHRDQGVVIPDFTLHWLRGMAQHCRITGDIDLAGTLLPSAERALHWFAQHADVNGCLSNLPYWHFIEWADLDRAGQGAAVNALYAAALGAVAQIADMVGYERAAQQYASLAERVKTALNDKFWNEARGAYVDAVNPSNGQQSGRISQQVNALMVAFDIAPEERWPRIVATITDVDALRFTAAPPIFPSAPRFDEAIHVVRANTYYCHFLYEALAKAGRFELAIAHMRDFYGAMLQTGTTTLWESFKPAASLCHVFSATPVYQLSRHLLGVHVIGCAAEAVRIAPQFCDLEHAEGSYPTNRGDVQVSWRQYPLSCELSVSAPSSMKLDVVAPTGFNIKQCEERTQGEIQVMQVQMVRTP